jgi:hypothetical protein
MPSACLTIWTPLILSHLSLCPTSPVETQISATLGPISSKGVLWREGDEEKSARRVVPKMYREQIVKLCHDPPLAGHQGIERTIEKVKSTSPVSLHLTTQAISGSLLGRHPGLFPLLGNLGIVGFVPPGPSMSSPLGR